MSDWFSRAALDRIAECVAGGAEAPEPSTAASLLKRYVESEPSHGLADKDFPDPVLADLFGPDRALDLHAFADLLELAVQTGYVDLGQWDDLHMLPSALTCFLERELATENATDVTLLEALIGRLERHELRVAERDDRAFFAFASLIHLTACVARDREAQDFLRASRNWPPGDDLPFLLTARHFAEARVRGTVAGVEATSLVAGFAVLRYLEWLAQILRRVEHIPGLAEAFVRQARWAHAVPAVSQRLDSWAGRMSEWGDSGVDEEGEAAWSTFRSTVLEPLTALVTKVRPQQAARREPNSLPSVHDLLAEGRMGAARRKARAEALVTGKSLREAQRKKDVNLQRAVGRVLVQQCESLAEMGDVDAAAALIVPHLDALVDTVDNEARAFERHFSTGASVREIEPRNRALALLARARKEAKTVSSSEAELLPAAPRPPLPTSRSETVPKHRSVGDPE